VGCKKLALLRVCLKLKTKRKKLNGENENGENENGENGHIE